jgi:uncharacterized protein
MMKKELIFSMITGYFLDKKVNKVFVFGSFARGTETFESDIDLLIELSQSIGLMKLIEYKLDLEDKLHRKIDLLTPESISPKILPFIQKEMKLLYAR